MRGGLTIGVPVRNEENCLPSFLASLETALGKLPDVTDMEIAFCLNGSEDNSRVILENWQRRQQIFESVRITISKQGKIFAIEKIIAERQRSGHLLFMDADLVLGENCLYELYQYLEQNAAVYAAYARVIPGEIRGSWFLRWLLSTHYSERGSFYRRRFLHGRCYALRGWPMPANHCYAARDHSIGTARRLRLAHGPIVDDIALSRWIVHEHGLHGIQEVPTARVWFTPPSSISDLYLAKRRIALEVKRLSLLNPEHNYVQDQYFSKPLDRRSLLEAPRRRALSFVLSHWTFRLIAFLARLEVALISRGLISGKDFWPPLLTTKRPVASDGQDELCE